MRRQRFMSAIADAVIRWPRAIISIGVVLAAVATFFAVHRLEFKTGRNDLIGRDSEYWKLYSQYAEEFHAEEDYLVVVESDRPERNRAAKSSIVMSRGSVQGIFRPWISTICS